MARAVPQEATLQLGASREHSFVSVLHSLVCTSPSSSSLSALSGSALPPGVISPSPASTTPSLRVVFPDGGQGTQGTQGGGGEEEDAGPCRQSAPQGGMGTQWEQREGLDLVGPVLPDGEWKKGELDLVGTVTPHGGPHPMRTAFQALGSGTISHHTPLLPISFEAKA